MKCLVCLTALVIFWFGNVLSGLAAPDPAALSPSARDGNLYLSLHEAIALALENNLDVELQRIGVGFSEADIKRAQAGVLPRGMPFYVREGPKSASLTDPLAPLLGPASDTNLSIAGQIPLSSGSPVPLLDPVLTGGFFYNHATTPQNNSFQAGTTSLISDTGGWNFSLQKEFVFGGRLAASFDSARQSINHPRYDLEPYNSASLGIRFTQPLLRGFGTTLNTRFQKIAVNSRRQAGLAFEQQVISTTAAVVRLYWDLVALRGDAEARRQAVQRAEKLLSDNQIQVDAGTRAPIDVVRARAEVARSRQDLIAAESLVRRQDILLLDYINRGTIGDPQLTGLRIVPTDPIRIDRTERLPELPTLIETALRQRPDIAQARVQIESSGLALAGSRDALRPSLDLVVSARNNGLAGEVNPLTLPDAAPHNPDPILVGGYGTALSQVLRRNFPDYGIGVQLTIPLRNQAAEADLARDNLVIQQQAVRLLQLQKQVHIDIQNALIALEQAQTILRAAEQEREFEEQATAAEEQRLAVGASTTYLVIQYQRDLAQAISAEIAARAGYVKARAALDRACGTLLEACSVSVTGTDIQFK